MKRRIPRGNPDLISLARQLQTEDEIVLYSLYSLGGASRTQLLQCLESKLAHKRMIESSLRLMKLAAIVYSVRLRKWLLTWLGLGLIHTLIQIKLKDFVPFTVARPGENGVTLANTPCDEYRPLAARTGRCWCGYALEEHPDRRLRAIPSNELTLHVQQCLIENGWPNWYEISHKILTAAGQAYLAGSGEESLERWVQVMLDQLEGLGSLDCVPFKESPGRKGRKGQT